MVLLSIKLTVLYGFLYIGKKVDKIQKELLPNKLNDIGLLQLIIDLILSMSLFPSGLYTQLSIEAGLFPGSYIHGPGNFPCS